MLMLKSDVLAARRLALQTLTLKGVVDSYHTRKECDIEYHIQTLLLYIFYKDDYNDMHNWVPQH